MADKPIDTLATLKPGEALHVPNAAGAVSIDTFGNHPVVYDGAPAAAPDQPKPDAEMADALKQLAGEPIVAQAADGPAPAPHAPIPGDNIEADHLHDLGQRQVAADKNSQAEDDFHASLDAPAPAAPPTPVPTIAPQPQIAQAGMLPAGALGDMARGAVEAPDMIMSGAKSAVHNLLAFSDHLADLVDEHIPLGTFYAGHPGGDMSQPFQIGYAPPGAAKPAGITHSGTAGALDAVAPDGPNDQPHSVTGGLIKGIAQFSTGYAMGGAALRGWKIAAGAGALTKSFAQGALADFGAFDAHQARLSNLLKDHVPAAIAPVVDYLASDPRDGEVEGRLKNALEGLGLGGAMHGIIGAARFLRSARIAQRAAGIAAQNEGLQGIVDAPQPEVQAAADKLQADLTKHLGNVGGKGFTITRKFPLKPGEVAAVADSGEQGPNTIGLNYAKIADTEDLQAAAVQFYGAFHPELTDAKRGVQSLNKQVRDAFGEDVAKLIGNWKPGTPMASHELTALRFAQAGAMKDFVGHARAIAGGDSTLATQAAFLQTGGVVDALSRAVEGGKAEAARTLRTLRETVPSLAGDGHTPEGSVEFYRKMDALISGAGGKEMIEKAAKSFLTVAQANPLGTSKFLRGLAWMGKFNDRSKEVIKVFTANGLLSIPGVTANVFGNTSALVWERMMRQLAPKLSNLVGSEAYIADGEAVASQAAGLSAFGDVFRLSQHINIANDLQAAEGTFNPLGLKSLAAHGRALAANFDAAKDATKGFVRAHREEVTRASGETGIGQTGLERGPENDTALGRVASLVYKAIKIPGKTHGVLDDFSNIVSGRAELASQAYRQAMKDADAGLITADQVGTQMTKHMEDPDAAMLQRVIEAQQNTSWTRKSDTQFGKFTEGIKGLRSGLDSLPIPLPLGTSVFPFVNTPANLFSYGIQNSIFAPLSARFRAAVMSSDGSTRQLALTKYAAGSMMSMWIMNHVANGTMTGGGPRDPAQREAMMRTDPDTHETIFQPYSARIGDHWVDMNRLDPFSTNYAMAADMSEAWMGNDWADSRVDTATDAFSAVAMSFGNAMLNKSTMQGASQFMDAMADYKRGGTFKADKFVEQRAVSAVPFSGTLMAARRAVDPYQRQVLGIVDAFKNNVPGLSDSLPLSFDLWGRKRTYDTGMGTAYDTIIPARAHPIGGEPIDREMLRLGFAKTMPAKMISLPGGRTADLKNEPLIANEILTRAGPGLLQELNDLVSDDSPNSPYYDALADGSDPHAPGTKARYLQNILDLRFSQARESIKRDFADDLTAIAAEQASRRAAARTGP